MTTLFRARLLCIDGHGPHLAACVIDRDGTIGPELRITADGWGMADLVLQCDLHDAWFLVAWEAPKMLAEMTRCGLDTGEMDEDVTPCRIRWASSVRDRVTRLLGAWVSPDEAIARYGGGVTGVRGLAMVVVGVQRGERR